MKTTIGIIALTLFSGLAGVTAAPTKTKPYTKDICIVTDNKLGSMGRVITKVHNGQEVKFCCKPCIKKFEKNPDRFLKKL
jgi:hypothetical protein